MVAVSASTLLRLSFSKVTRNKIFYETCTLDIPCLLGPMRGKGFEEVGSSSARGSCLLRLACLFIRYYLVLDIKTEWDIFQLVFYAVQNTFSVQEEKKKLKSYFGEKDAHFSFLRH